jgi:hypothetical protein
MALILLCVCSVFFLVRVICYSGATRHLFLKICSLVIICAISVFKCIL